MSEGANPSNIPFAAMSNDFTKYTYLLHRSILDAVALVGGDRDYLVDKISQAVPVTRFANNSIGFSEDQGYRIFEDEAGADLRKLALELDETLGPTNLTSVLGGTVFYGLKDFGASIIQMYFWGNHTRELECNRLHVATAIERDRFKVAEWPLNNMQITLALKYRTTKSSYQDVASTIRTWANGALPNSLAEKSPVELLSDLQTWHKLCQVRVSLESANQDIVNDFLLRVVDLMEKVIVTDVYFTKQPGAMITFEELFRIKGKPKIVCLS